MREIDTDLEVLTDYRSLTHEEQVSLMEQLDEMHERNQKLIDNGGNVQALGIVMMAPLGAITGTASTLDIWSTKGPLLGFFALLAQGIVITGGYFVRKAGESMVAIGERKQSKVEPRRKVLQELLTEKNL